MQGKCVCVYLSVWCCMYLYSVALYRLKTVPQDGLSFKARVAHDDKPRLLQNDDVVTHERDDYDYDYI